jgi:protease I
MANKLEGKRIAILVEEGFELEELEKPRAALQEAGAETHIISPKSGQIKAWAHTGWGDSFTVDKELSQAQAQDYDGLLLPGGVLNPDKLRMNKEAVRLVQDFYQAGKPIAAICHGPWLLAEAGIVKGRTLTSYPSIQTDLKNAGATWVDEEVVTDKGVVTSRKPADIPAFNRKMIEEFAEGVHKR